MTRTLFHRPTRVTAPPAPPEPELIPAPPALTDQSGAMPLQFLLPLIGAVSSVVMMVVLRNGQPLFLVLAAVIFVVAIVGGLGFALSARGRAARKARTQRELYLDYLERYRSDLRERGANARATAIAVHPAPESLVGVMRDPARRWERRRTDDDYLAAAWEWHRGRGSRSPSLRTTRRSNPPIPSCFARRRSSHAVSTPYPRCRRRPICGTRQSCR